MARPFVLGMKASVAQVTWVNAKECCDQHVSNSVSLDGADVKTIEAGNSFRMEIHLRPRALARMVL